MVDPYHGDGSPPTHPRRHPDNGGTSGDSVKMLNAMMAQFQKICRDNGRNDAVPVRVALQRPRADAPVLTTHSSVFTAVIVPER
jgi:hypothetical protein